VPQRDQLFADNIPENFLHRKSFGKRISQHLFFWSLYYLFYGYWILYLLYQIRDPAFYVQALAFIPFDIGLVYLNFYLLIPALLYHRRFVAYGLALAGSTLAVGCINMLLKQYFASQGSAIHAISAGWTLANLIGLAMERMYLLGLTTGILLARNWLRNIQLMKEKEKHYLETELSFLKSQIQPHFFFNTLNNLYSLTLNKSDAAPDVVLKLSELMSYMLYESNTPLVALDKEISYLHNFIDLEQLRFGDRVKVNFEVESSTEHISIPPLVLIFFVENSFKHGVRNNLNHINIDISLGIVEQKLIFEISNPSEGLVLHAGKSGIGLKNVKRRLDLLYDDRYQLKMFTDNGIFRVLLQIPLS
jgi:two-component system, LytTR family, sensor kinase